jgi:valyl-tRNA synthetase
MANAVYHFVWDTYCDWYVELVKGAFDEETKTVAAWAFDQILVMLHPLMPFITEELWQAMGEREDYPLITAKWPDPQAQADRQAKAEMEWLIGIVSSIRSARTEVSVPPGEKLFLLAPSAGQSVQERLARQQQHLKRLARLDIISNDPAPAHGNLVVVHEDTTYFLPLEGIIDIEAEKARLDKAAAGAEKERDSLAQRLANPNFTERAKPEAVEKARSDHEAKAAEAERLRAALERLG